MKKKLLYILILVFAGIQFIRIDKTNPKTDPENEFISIEQPSEEIGNLLRTACYDCHSNHTLYPWYSNIAPVSWFLKSHINEGREHLNFSEWGHYSMNEQKNKREEIAEEIIKDEMPLSAYTLLHSSAKLSTEQKNKLSNWFKEL
jgi:hypothetical protein